jgi:hypothetical protein
MKKFIFLLSLVLVGFVAQAQDVNMKVGTYGSYAYAGVSDITGTAGTINKTFFTSKDYIYLYNVTVDIDTFSGTGTNTVYLKGSNDGVNYYTITSKTHKSTSGDTVIQFNDVSTGVLWRYLRVTETAGSSTRTKIGSIAVKISAKP